ncbi:arginine--tRNA ligase [Shigella flexneri]
MTRAVRSWGYLGHKVMRANHVGDWGTQVGAADRVSGKAAAGKRRRNGAGGPGRFLP